MIINNFINRYLNSLKIMSSFFLKFFGEKRLVKSIKRLPLSIKSINLKQKYPHITESCDCILNVFVFIFLFVKNVLISFGIYSTPKPSK